MNDTDASASRPSTARRVSFEEPAASDTASPAKEHSDATRLTPSTHTTGHLPENIPPRPTYLEAVPQSSFFDSPAPPGGYTDAQAELAIRQHLQDIESSFLSPIPLSACTSLPPGAFSFGSPAKRPASQRLSSNPDTSGDLSQLAPLRRVASASPRRVKSPSPVRDTIAAAIRALSPTLDRFLSSSSRRSGSASSQHPDEPTANHHNTDLEDSTTSSIASAEIARAVSRAISRVRSPTASSRDPDNQSAEDTSILDPAPHASSDKLSVDAGSTPGQALKSAKRPKYLRSRVASQRSSVSSFVTDPESDVTVGLGADYALQSGGAVPSSSGMPRTPTSVLSRSVSMGSMASGIEDLHDSSGSAVRHLETLDEVPQTPKPSKAATAALAAPTDTVIARHVRDVRVPESLAEEYKTRGGLVTPARIRAFGASATSRHGKSLTLREQNNTIERLSKENFDLKLKVMFLSDRLDKLSEEGIKEMISENVDLKTGLAVLQRDNKVLRRRVKQLEKKLKDEEDRPGTAKSTQSDDEQSAAYDQEQQEKDEELLYLREQLDEYVSEVERLRGENMNKEAEKRRMAEVVRSLGERAGDRIGEDFERQEEADVWKDLLEQETARREQGDEDNRRLRDEVFRLKQELSGQVPNGPLHHTTNIYNITKRSRDQPSSPTRPATSFSGDQDGIGAPSMGSTLVEDLRRESDQLRHENAELRREVGAQTSMLTSRNREKERLYQEIEDLKMSQRRGVPAPSTIDSILERSASRSGAHDRPQSRGSAMTGVTGTALDDADREELENKIAQFRDRNNTLKLQNQDLQRELNACMDDFETAVEAKKQAEELVSALQDDLDTAMNDMMALQAERDDALQDHASLENEFEALRKEAQEEIDALESEADHRNTDIERLQFDLNDRNDNFGALQGEMRKMSEVLVRLEDDQEANLRRVQQLEQDLVDANKELEDLESKLLEANDKANRLSVQQESSQGEIAFLREEQESDKIRIGDLIAALANTEQILRDEKDRARDLEQTLATERRQREIVANREKEEVQQFVNELNREASTAKDEARRLRKSLTSREVEATEWKERLIELENNLREALGDLNGTRSSLLKSIAKLQRDLENTVRDLETTKSSLVEKDRIIKQRDALLESHALESRKLAEMLDKERQAHRNVKHQFETFQKTHQHVTHTVSSQDTRIMELESAKAQDKKRISQLENNFKDQLTERNNLLLILWTRLSALCGTDWAHDNSLINGRALPSLEAVSTMLPGFSKNLVAAVKTIETMVGSFQNKVKSVEKDLWREYQTLENHLDSRTKKLDRLETIVRNNIATGALGGPHSRSVTEIQARATKLEDAYRQLKIENHTLRAAADARASRHASSGDRDVPPMSPGAGSPSPLVPTGPKAKDRSGSRIPKSGIPTRGSSGHHYQFYHHPSRRSLATSGSQPESGSTSGDVATEDDDTITGSTPTSAAPPPQASSSTSAATSVTGGSTDNKWMLRLRDLEHKLKAEREGRIMDRGEAMRRIDASENEVAALRGDLERERERRSRGGQSQSGRG